MLLKLTKKSKGIAYISFVALPTRKVWSLGGTYDNSQEMSQIYVLDCGDNVENCPTAEWVLNESTALSKIRSGKVAMLLPSEYLCCEGDSECTPTPRITSNSKFSELHKRWSF